MKQQAAIKGVNFYDVSILDQAAYLCVDKDCIQHILQNLIMNGISQSNEGGCVILQVNEHRLEEGRTSLMFCLINHDGSIDPKDFNKIFSGVFSSLGSEHRAAGRPFNLARLSLCNQLIQKLDGRMEIAQTLGGGDKI